MFAVGDINTYPGKKKLILSGFHEAALAAFAIQHHLYPQKKQFLQYTTTSPVMHQRLGRAGLSAHGPRLADLLPLLELEQLEVNLFRGESRDIGSPQVFGGQVLGQALSAAARTVDAGAWCTRCTPTSCAAATAMRRSSTRSTAASTATASPTAAWSRSSTASRSSTWPPPSRSPRSGFDHQIDMPPVPPPEQLHRLRRAAGASCCERLPERVRRFFEQPRPFEFRMVQPIDYLQPRRELPVRQIWFRAVARVRRR